MLTDDTAKAVTDALGLLTGNDEMFTAFDITNGIRRNVDPKAPHHEVKKLVHSEFTGGNMHPDYIRTSVDLDVTAGPKGSTAFVYHPNWKQSMDYDPKVLQGDAIDPFLVDNRVIDPTTQKYPQYGQQTTSSVGTPGFKVVPKYKPSYTAKKQVGHDKRGRICVPAKVIREAGLARGDKVFVGVTPKATAVILATDPAAYGGLSHTNRTYKVDASGNIRLSRFVANMANLKQPCTFDVSSPQGSQTTITISS